jgi:hypothetical protein
MAVTDRESGQWIIMISMILSVSIFFLAVILNQSILVGQTTAESVLEFPKADIHDLRAEAYAISRTPAGNCPECYQDLSQLSLERKNAVIFVENNSGTWTIHYDNGVTSYDETIGSWNF